MITVTDHAVFAIGLGHLLTHARSALPESPVVPDTPRTSLIDRTRLTIVAASRFVSRPTPDAARDPAVAQG